MLLRNHIVAQFSRGIYDIIIATDENLRAYATVDILVNSITSDCLQCAFA